MKQEVKNKKSMKLEMSNLEMDQALKGFMQVNPDNVNKKR